MVSGEANGRDRGAYLEILDDALQGGVSAQRPGWLVMERVVGGSIGSDGELRWVLGDDAGGGGVGLSEDGGGGEKEGGDDGTVVA